MEILEIKEPNTLEFGEEFGCRIKMHFASTGIVDPYSGFFRLDYLSEFSNIDYDRFNEMTVMPYYSDEHKEYKVLGKYANIRLFIYDNSKNLYTLIDGSERMVPLLKMAAKDESRYLTLGKKFLNDDGEVQLMVKYYFGQETGKTGSIFKRYINLQETERKSAYLTIKLDRLENQYKR